jgi:hypothetical protein
MAAGTEIAQPVSALDGAYKPLPLDDGNPKENGSVVDNNKNSSAALKGKDIVVDKDSDDGRPPRPLMGSMSAPSAVSIRGCVTRALVSEVVQEDQDAVLNGKGGVKLEFQPVYRSGVWYDTGGRSVMEDAHVRIDDLETHLSSEGGVETSGAFYGVSD